MYTRLFAASRTTGQRPQQLTVAQLVDERGIAYPAIRSLFIEYLTERSATVDYATLVGLVRVLVRNFWTDIEIHHPNQHSIRLSAEVGHLPDGRERQDYFVHLMTVRGFYLDLAQWALPEPEGWAGWACPHPSPPQKQQDSTSRSTAGKRGWTSAPALWHHG